MSEAVTSLEKLMRDSLVKKIETEHVTAYRMPTGYRLDVKDIDPT